MAKKKSEKKKKGTSASSKAKAPGLLPGLGGLIGEDDNSGNLDFTGHDMERFQRVLLKKMSEEDIEDIDEANAFLENLLSGETLDELLGEEEFDPVCRAQDLAFAAFEADTDGEALILCGRAIENDPGCVDALMLIAQITVLSDDEYILQLRGIVEGAETRFGQKFMEECRGSFWGMTETRPYMRARATLIIALDESGQISEAIKEAEVMLGLNPNDNQGIRDGLRSLYLREGNLEGVRRLREEYPDSAFAISNWSKVLEQFLSGNVDAAEFSARKAHKDNAFVVGYLSRKKRLPASMPGGFSVGSKEEAMICYKILRSAWGTYPDAVKWLKGLGLK